MLLSFLCACLPVQDQAPAGRLTLDGTALGSPVAVVSPIGWVEATGQRGADLLTVKLRFPAFEWPEAREHDVPGEAVRAWLGAKAGEDGTLLRGKLQVTECGPARVCFVLRYEQDGSHVIECDLPAAMYVPKVEPTVSGKFGPPDDEPDSEDVVFCAFGNGGTGLPGQRKVADAIASLAPTGPLDFVILLGNNFLPRGVQSERDPLFKTRFEEVYDPRRLAVPFYVIQGPADHRGDPGAATSYGAFNQRWTTQPTGFSVEFTSRGKKLAVFGGDSTFLGGPIPDPRTRSALRMLFDLARDSKADWKIVCTYDQIVSLGGRDESANIKLLEARSLPHLQATNIDLLLCADGRGLRLVVPEKGIPQVLSGGGGGPELAGVVENVPGTRCAYGGGGFTWIRFDGKRLQVSLRDTFGKVLFVHEIAKP